MESPASPLNSDAILSPEHDPLGQAALAYWREKTEVDIQVHSDVGIEDVLPVKWLFRSHEQMPDWEQQALTHCQGKVLDIGAGVGSHSLYLQEQGHEVCALDISPGAVAVMQDRGVKRTLLQDLWAFPPEPFDTLLLMMNGIGFVGNLLGLNRFLQQAKQWLAPGGQILLDSSDVRYFYEQDGEYFLPEDQYYGIIQYRMHWKDCYGPCFDWLYIEPQRLQKHAKMFGYQYNLLATGPHFEYLAQLSL
ncbi:MAG: class I SAM-dependent methyltransferase [Bacteroidota bacterium]